MRNSERRLRRRDACAFAVLYLLCAAAVLSARPAAAANVTYVYDDLGRLVRVIDQTTGQAATYQYDAVGNIISITRETVDELQPQIGAIHPISGRAASSVAVTITGQNLLGAAVTTDNAGIAVQDSRAEDETITATFVISATAPPGTARVTVDTGLGVATVPFTVLPPAPKPSLSPRELALAPGTAGTLTLSLSNADVFDTQITVTIANPAVASVGVGSLTIPAGQTTAPVSVTAGGLGVTTVLATAEGGSATTSVFVTAPFSGTASVAAAALSVRLLEAPGQLQEAITAPLVSVQVAEPTGSVLEAIVSPLVSVQVPPATGSVLEPIVAPLVSVQVPEPTSSVLEAIVSPLVSVQVPAAAGSVLEPIVAPLVSVQVPEPTSSVLEAIVSPLVSVQVPAAAGSVLEPIVAPLVSVQVPQAGGASTEQIFVSNVTAQVP